MVNFKEKVSRINFIANMILLMLLMVGVATSNDFNLGISSTFANITTGNITVTDGVYSNVVLTTNTDYLKNSSVKNTSTVTVERAGNGSVYFTASGITFKNVTNSRSLGTPYQNLNSTPRFVAFNISMDASSVCLEARADGNNPPQQTVDFGGLAGGETARNRQLHFSVMPNEYYGIYVVTPTGCAGSPSNAIITQIEYN